MLLLLMLRSSHHRPTERLSLSVVLTDRVPKLIILDATTMTDRPPMQLTDAVCGEFEQTHTDPHGRGAARSSGRARLVGWLGGISGSVASEAEAAAVASLPRSCSIYRSIHRSISHARAHKTPKPPSLSPFEPTLV